MTDLSRTRSSARAAVVIAGASAVLAITGYLFNVGVIRFLGPGGYAEVAALLAVIGLVALPLGSITSLAARETAFLLAAGHHDDVRASARWMLKWGLLTAVALGLLITVISPVVASALEIHSAWPVVMMGWGVAAAAATAPLLGLAQGAQDFTAVGTALGGFGVLRVALLVPALLAGWGTGGALGASLVASLAVLAWTLWAVRHLLARPSAGRPVPDIEAAPAAVLIVATLAFGSLTNVDVLFAGLLLPQYEAGNYAAAALFAKAALLIPASVAIVLLPRATSLAWLTPEFRRVAIKSLVATLLLTAVVAVVIALLPSGLLLALLGSGFGDVRALLPWFAPVMVLGAWVQVLLYLYLSQRQWSFPLAVVVAAAAQVLLFIVWHPSAWSFVATTGLCLAGLIAVHEAFMPLRLVRIAGPTSR